MIFARHHFAPGWRFDADIDVLGKPVDDAVAFRKRRSALQLEGHAEFLQAVEAMHYPVIFFDQGGLIDRLLVRNDPDECWEVEMMMEIITRHEAP